MLKTLRKGVFLLPEGSRKVLTDVGWEFTSGTFLSGTIVLALMDSLGLSRDEEFLGIEIYRNESLQANVEKSDTGSVEFVYFQCDTSFLPQLKATLLNVPNAEVFIPSELKQSKGAASQ